MAEDNQLDNNRPGNQETDIELDESSMQLPGDDLSVKHPAFGSKGKILSAKKILAFLLVLILVVGVGWGLWNYIKSTSKPPEQNPSAINNSSPQAMIEEQIPDLAKTYDSSVLRVSFKYPDNWSVNEDGRTIVATSPNVEYQTNDGEQVSGKAYVYIAKGARESDRDFLGRGFALEASEKIEYTDPLPGQLKSTYLTSFGLDKTDNFAYFLVQGNFNLKTGDSLGPDYAKEPDAYLIGGGFSTAEAVTGLSDAKLAVDSYKKLAEYKIAIEISKSLQLK